MFQSGGRPGDSSATCRCSPSAAWKGKSGISPYADFVMETEGVSFPVAVERLVSVKGRPDGKPILVLIGQRTQLPSLVREVPPLATVLMDLTWLDVGSWPAYGQTLGADADGNRAGGATLR